MPKLTDYLIYFLIGGTVTVLITGLEETGMPYLSGIATLFPVFTWVSYLFIGANGNNDAVVQNANFVLWGTIVSWIPYMITIIYFTPKLGVNKAILVSMGVFLAFAAVYILLYHLFVGN
ncbi:GlpM protein [uncultured archaeon]|nr:GlpM protein [uncultured archaeon]